MNADHLLDHFVEVCDTPDAVTCVRRFILDSAVRGQLVAQNPNDEPASELLKRISSEKRGLVKAKKIKEPPRLETVETDDQEFPVPSSWCWTRLGEVTSYIQRGKSPKYASGSGPLVVSQKCVQWSGLNLDKARAIAHQSLSAYQPIRYLREDDLLWNSTGTGTIGRVVRLVAPPEKLVCDSHVTVVRCLLVSPEFVRTWLRTSNVYGRIEERAAGSTNQVELTAQMAVNQVVPLPPLAEQHRIVAKVDELMALCDRLEEAQTEQEAMRNRLAAASLARLNVPDPDPASFQSHATFALENLTPLTTRPDQIGKLRKTILNLAVFGKLVPQDPQSVPASQLLARIIRKKAQLVSAGTIKLRKLNARERTDPLDYSIPPGWELADLGTIAEKITDGAHKTPTYVEDGVPFVSVKDFSRGILDLSNTRYIPPNEHKILYQRCDPRRGDILIGRIGTLGKAVLVNTDVEFSLFVSVGLIRFDHRYINPEFFRFVLNSPFVEAEFNRIKIGGGTHTNKLNLGDLHTVAFPLPPIGEQHRMVAKVHELMTLCDRLEESLTTVVDTRHRLLEAVLRNALEPHADSTAAA